jgi:formate hydrogenlyase subunit 3/multisubunit Na+/H+ antiporter MnhD subunit
MLNENNGSFLKDDAPLGMIIPTLVLAALCIVFGVGAFIPVSVAEQAARMLLGGA